MGAERRSMAMTDEEKKLTAYHEGGHAVVALHESASDPIHKATIIPRGRALGMVMRLPEGDRISMSKEKLIADLAVAMGGRIAEELIFGEDKVTTGASSDIKMATNIARRMVMEWGMSDILGTVNYGNEQDEVFLGYQMGKQKQMSEETANKIDAEVRRIVDAAYNKAKTTLQENAQELENLAQALLEYETLTGDEIPRVVKGEKLNRSQFKDDDAEIIQTGSVPTAGGADLGEMENNKED